MIMGAIIPTELVILICKDLGIRDFVETGTYDGATAIKMAKIFERVWTIEVSWDLYAKAKINLKSYSNIESVFGDSTDVLPSVLQKIRKPAVFWLDAHWSGGDTGQGTSECPVTSEISLIRADNADHVILIDDARYFLAPPPLPHKRDEWPDITQIVDTLQHHKPEPYILILEDVIVAVPKKLQNFVENYWQNKLISKQVESTKSNSLAESIYPRIGRVMKALIPVKLRKILKRVLLE